MVSMWSNSFWSARNGLRAVKHDTSTSNARQVGRKKRKKNKSMESSSLLVQKCCTDQKKKKKKKKERKTNREKEIFVQFSEWEETWLFHHCKKITVTPKTELLLLLLLHLILILLLSNEASSWRQCNRNPRRLWEKSSRWSFVSRELIEQWMMTCPSSVTVKDKAEGGGSWMHALCVQWRLQTVQVYCKPI